MSYFLCVEEKVKILVVAVIYFVLTLMGRVFELPYGYSSPMYLAAGFSIAAVIIWGKRSLFGIFAAHIAFDFYQNYQDVITGIINYQTFFFYPVIACLQAFIGAKIASRYYNRNQELSRGEDIFKFVFFTAIISPLVTCLVAISPWMISLNLSTYNKYSTIIIWYLGDAVGIAVGLTAFLMIFDRGNSYFKGRERLVLAYSMISFLFLSFYLLTMVSLEKERRQEDLNSKALQALYRIQNQFTGLQSQLISIKNFIAASDDVNEIEFQTFSQDIFQRYEGIEFINVASTEKGFPFIYQAPENYKKLADLFPYKSLLRSLERTSASLVVGLEDNIPYFYVSIPLLKTVPGKRTKEFTGIVIAKANTNDFIKSVFLLDQGNTLRMELYQVTKDGPSLLYESASAIGYSFTESHLKYIKKTRSHGKDFEYHFTLDQNYVISKISMTFIMSGIVTLFVAVLMSVTGLSHAARTIVADNRIDNKLKSLESKNSHLIKKNKVQSELIIEVNDGLIQCIRMFKQYYKMLKNEFTTIPFQDELLEMTKVVEKSYEHFQRILEVSKLEVGEIRFMKIPFSTKKIIQEIKSYYQISMQKNDMELKVYRDPSVPDYLVGDKGLLKELILAYLKGLVDQVNHVDAQIYLSLSLKNSKPYLKVLIEDSYDSNDHEKDQEEIFDYNDLSENMVDELRGRKLNLHYCANLAQEMGGEIFFGKKAQRRNRTFILEVPVGVHYDETGYGKLLKGMEKRLLNLSHLKVLLVENNESDLVIFQHFFEKMSINYIAQPTLDHIYDMAEKFDVVFVNISLMNETEFRHKNFIAILDNSEEIESESFKRGNFSDYLVKPVHLSDMIGVLGKFTHKKPRV